jgi:hypothetical protein
MQQPSQCSSSLMRYRAARRTEVGRPHPAQGDIQRELPPSLLRGSVFRKTQLAFFWSLRFHIFRGPEKGKCKKKSLEPAVPDQAVFAIQLSILNRMSSLGAFLGLET